MEKEFHRTAFGWSTGVVERMLEMVNSKWKYCCNIVHEQEEAGLQINHHNWFKGYFQLYQAKGKENMKVGYHLFVRMKFRDLWSKGDSDKIVWLRAVLIARVK